MPSPSSEQTPAQVTQDDRDALAALDDALGFMTDIERPIALQFLASHREAAERRVVEALSMARDTIVQHHQWHSAQAEPDPEHGYIPADEYADSGLYERTVATLAALDPFLRSGPRDTEGHIQENSNGEK